MRKLNIETTNKALSKAFELQGYLKLRDENRTGNASGSTAGLNQMTNPFLTENTSIFDQFVRMLKETPITSWKFKTENCEINFAVSSEKKIVPRTGGDEMALGRKRKQVWSRHKRQPS